MKLPRRILASCALFGFGLFAYNHIQLNIQSLGAEGTEHLRQQLSDAQRIISALKDEIQHQGEATESDAQSQHRNSKDVPKHGTPQKPGHGANDVFTPQASSAHTDSEISGPALEHEQVRRRTENNVHELWLYMEGQIKSLADRTADKTSMKASLQAIINDGSQQYRTIMKDFHELRGGGGAQLWREREAAELSHLVQNRLHYLQNPANCSTAKKLYCDLDSTCGFGCQIHHVLYCLLMAYTTKRTLVLDSSGWHYLSNGWEKVFMPLSKTCKDASGSNSTTWTASSRNIENIQVVTLPVLGSNHPTTKLMPEAIPRDIAHTLMRLHANPFLWWTGQFLQYILRPNAFLQSYIDDTKQRLGFKGPIVGVQVRRTDKVQHEAGFHRIEEYMAHVESYYKLLATRQNISQKLIYLATDEPTLLAETRQKYPDYTVLSEQNFTKAADTRTRYSENSLLGSITDIYLLAHTDHLVCTFSSNMCRKAYELMQSLHPDASDRYKSLDNSYYFHGHQANYRKAIYSHKARGLQEVDLTVGDPVALAGNHWDGYSKGTNVRTHKTGLFPSYKIQREVLIADFPDYKDADLSLR